MALGEAVGDQVRALPFASVNQTSFLFGALFFAFLFFVTVRGDLGKWLGLLGLAGSTGQAGGASLTAQTQAAATANVTSGSAGIPALPNLPQLSAGSF
jgi:hypothetical protein